MMASSTRKEAPSARVLCAQCCCGFYLPLFCLFFKVYVTDWFLKNRSCENITAVLVKLLQYAGLIPRKQYCYCCWLH